MTTQKDVNIVLYCCFMNSGHCLINSHPTKKKYAISWSQIKLTVGKKQGFLWQCLGKVQCDDKKIKEIIIIIMICICAYFYLCCIIFENWMYLFAVWFRCKNCCPLVFIEYKPLACFYHKCDLITCLHILSIPIHHTL